MSLSLSPLARSVQVDEYHLLIEQLLHRLFPICRSITGDGVRTTLKILSEYLPLEVIEMPSGTPVYDWVIPNEWNIKDAYIKNSAGQRVVDFNKSNLHIVGYSVPVRQRMTMAELRPYLHTLPDQPDAIPYLTSYYKPDWGFCMTQKQFNELSEDEYEVCIDSNLRPGSLSLAEAVLPGETEEEIFFSTYSCHPSLANNELSGPVLATVLYKYLAYLPKRKYTYRFYFGPETIGALTYLNLRGNHLREKMKAGFVVTCCGDGGDFTYKQGRNRDNIFDRVVIHAVKGSGVEYQLVPFFPTGSDERQYCSPGFNLPVGSLMRSMYGTYPEYHTSLDNLDFVTADSLMDTLSVYLNMIYAFEHNMYYQNLKPFGEPMLSQYGLYNTLGGQKVQGEYTKKIRYLLNYSDGKHDLIEIADLLGEPIWGFEDAVQDLIRVGLLTTAKSG